MTTNGPDFTGIIDHLTAERNRALGEQRAVIEGAVKAKREMTGEERAVVERTDAAIDKIDGEVAEWRTRIEREEAAQKADEGIRSVLTREQRERAERSQNTQDAYIEKFLRGELRGEVGDPKMGARGRGIEVDLIPTMRAMTLARQGGGSTEYRVLSVVTAAAGGTLVPTLFANRLLQAMETIAGPIKAGCEILTTAGGESFVYGTEATAGTAAIVGEGSALAGSDPTFGRVTLGSYKFAELIGVNNELISDSGIDIIDYVGRTSGKALARVANTNYTTGSGSNAPQGFVVGGGNGGTTQASATGVPSYSDLVNLIYNVSDEAYAGENSVFMTTFANIKDIRKIKDGAGIYIWEPSLAAGQPSTLLGYKLVTNPAMRAWATAAGSGGIAFGDFGEGFVVRNVGQVRFERSDDYAFNLDQVTFRAVLRTDSKVKFAGAIRVTREPTT